MKIECKRLKELFLANLYISACTFGGGFVITTFMRKKLVNELHFIEDDEMLDLVAIAQSAPGSISVNAAILVGFHIGGILGLILSVIATIIPPFFIMLFIFSMYNFFNNNPYVNAILKGVQIAVIAIIFDTAFELGLKIIRTKNLFYLFMLLSSLVASYYFGIDAILIIMANLVLGILYSFYQIISVRL